MFAILFFHQIQIARILVTGITLFDIFLSLIRTK